MFESTFSGAATGVSRASVRMLVSMRAIETVHAESRHFSGMLCQLADTGVDLIDQPHRALPRQVARS